MIRIFLLAALMGLVSAQENSTTAPPTGPTSTAPDADASPSSTAPDAVVPAVPTAGPSSATGEFIIADAAGSRFPNCNATVLKDTQTYNDMVMFCNQALTNATDLTNTNGAILTCQPIMSCTASYKVTYTAVATMGTSTANNALIANLARAANTPAQMTANFNAAATTLGWTVGTISGSTSPAVAGTGATALTLGTTGFKCTATQKKAGTGCSGDLGIAAQQLVPSTAATGCVQLTGFGTPNAGLLVNGWLAGKATSVLSAPGCTGTFANVPTASTYASAPACILQSSLTGVTNDVLIVCTADAPAPNPTGGSTTTSSAITTGLSAVVGTFAILFM